MRLVRDNSTNSRPNVDNSCIHTKFYCFRETAMQHYCGNGVQLSIGAEMGA